MITNTFHTTALAGNRVLISGKDVAGDNRQVIVDSSEYDSFKLRDHQLDAGKEYDAAVAAFFAPLTDAAEKVQAARTITADPAFFTVIQEAQTAVHAQREVVHTFAKDTVVLRLIEQGNTERLIWVGDDIEVLAYQAQPVEVVAGDVTDVTDATQG